MKPVTVQGDDAQDWLTVAAVASDDVAVTVYEVIAEPPFDAGVVQLTEAVPFAVVDGVAATPVGAPGTSAVPHLRAR